LGLSKQKNKTKIKLKFTKMHTLYNKLKQSNAAVVVV
jgi:hypothetical protein